MTVPDPVEISLGEVNRNVNRLSTELQAGLLALSNRVDKAMDISVSSQVYAADKAGIDYRLSDIERMIIETKLDIKSKFEGLIKEQEKREEMSRGQKNLLLVGLIFPTLILVLNTAINFYFKATGK